MTLHITTTQRVIAKHRNSRHIGVEAARDELQRLALCTRTEVDERLVEELERRTGCSVGELLVKAIYWTA